jgi:hypothetical protein
MSAAGSTGDEPALDVVETVEVFGSVGIGVNGAFGSMSALANRRAIGQRYGMTWRCFAGATVFAALVLILSACSSMPVTPSSSPDVTGTSSPGATLQETATRTEAATASPKATATPLSTATLSTTTAVGDWVADCGVVSESDCRGIVASFVTGLAGWGVPPFPDGSQVAVLERPECPTAIPTSAADTSLCWQVRTITRTASGESVCMVIARDHASGFIRVGGDNYSGIVVLPGWWQSCR